MISVSATTHLLKPYEPNCSIRWKISWAFSSVSPRSRTPLTKSARRASMMSCFFLLMALMHAYALDSSMPPSRFRMRMICS